MTPLPSDLRSTLEKAVIDAREAAEEAARTALKALAVDQAEPFPSLTEEQRRLHAALRARMRQLGGDRQDLDFGPLAEEVAYQQWHRMLFARFLAENSLLMHPDGVPVTIQDCTDLAPEEGEADAWLLAARYAAAMLPGIFRPDDPASQVRFAPEGRDRLERILNDLPSSIFTADDSLGWVYQFWQTKKKKEVSASGRKIGGADLAAYTQLFTEHYMVRFLLENSLGAWWAARHPDSPLLKQFDYLRFRDDGTPAAGTFPGWPQRAAEVTVMDPCCGSGHFLVAAFDMLRQMRMEEEGFGEVEAADAVLRENLFGLEIDPRCTQISAFALAFAAWKVGGYRRLPLPNIACSGIAVEGQLSEWTRLAGDDVNLKATLERLYQVFRNASDLGSLINPADVPLRDRMFATDYGQVEPLLGKVLAREIAGRDPAVAVFGAAAEGAVRAASLLAASYTLIATNVPYLSRGKQVEVLKQFSEMQHPEAKADLATAFLERSNSLIVPGGSCAVVTPQNWLFLGRYEHLRRMLLEGGTWNFIAKLGAHAFETVSGEVVKAVLLVIDNFAPAPINQVWAIDASASTSSVQKDITLRRGALQTISQAEQLRNPDARVVLELTSPSPRMDRYAFCPRGVVTGDGAMWIRCFWELPSLGKDWRYLQSTVEETMNHGGRQHVINWSTNGQGMLRPGIQNPAYGGRGIAVSEVGSLACTLYTGELYDNNTAVIIPRDASHLSAIWAFCRSTAFPTAVRVIDSKLNVTNATFEKVPFDLPRWRAIAAAAGPMPELRSDDPTQWLFKGYPAGSTEPLQVAIARLAGYRWPQQEKDDLFQYADEDGIVCLPAVAGEQPGAERLRALLARAYGGNWSPAQQERLLISVEYSGKGLDEWLRDGFFAQHCKLFHNRPFIWHIRDGRRDGFAALVNYHKLDRANLDRLTYTYLGSWIAAQRADRDAGVAGAEGRLVAALELQKKLELIRDGEPPYDIYVRWKPLEKQPIGWEPDLNDGVRLNIRPFVTAGVLRSKFTINWNKDRGTNPDGSERLNDLHFTIAEKQAARAKAGIR